MALFLSVVAIKLQVTVAPTQRRAVGNRLRIHNDVTRYLGIGVMEIEKCENLCWNFPY